MLVLYETVSYKLSQVFVEAYKCNVIFVLNLYLIIFQMSILCSISVIDYVVQ
jgi:hypothetical protein